MKKFMVFVVVLLMAVGLNYGKKLTTIKGLGKPNLLIVDNERILINEGADIYIYALKDYSLLKKFGKSGEGPQEFMIHPTLFGGGLGIEMRGDNLYITSIRKLSFFKVDGTFLKEMKAPFVFGNYNPLGTNFAGLGVSQDNNQDFFNLNIYDPNLENKKEVYKFLAFEKGKNINPVEIMVKPKLIVRNNKMFIVDRAGVMHIFDEKGAEIQKIAQEYDRIEVTKERIKRYADYFLSNPAFKDRYERDVAAHVIKYPDSFPPIRDYQVSDDKIYVVTYKEEGTNREIYIFDMGGKLVKKGMYPLQEMNGVELYPYCITNGNLYQLVENLDIEEWDLVETEIK